MADNITDSTGNINNLNYYQDLNKNLASFSELLSEVMMKEKARAKNIEDARNKTKEIRKFYYDLSNNLRNLNKIADQYNINRVKTRDIEKQIEKVSNLQRLLRVKEAQAIEEKNGSLQAAINKALDESFIYEKELIELKKGNKEIDRRVGLFQGLLKGLKKVPVIGDILHIDDAIAEMRELAKEGATYMEILTAGIKETFIDVGRKALLSLFWGIVIKEAFKANKQVTDLSKSLIKTRSGAESVRQSFVFMSHSISDTFITTTKLVEANLKLSDLLGVSRKYSKDILTQFINLTQKMGLSEEAAAGLARLSIINSKTLKETKITTLEQIQAISAQYGVQLNNKQILEEVSKTSGQILANFKGNPKALAEAIATTKALGTSLDIVRHQSEVLLDFESNIENTLKAQLLTGQSLNLERARAAALQGDYLTVLKELNNQNISWLKFTHLNVLQQKALAESLGLSSDQLSDQLMKQEFIHKSKQEILALGGEEIAQRMEQLSAQDKFNAAMDKLKDIVVNLVAGPMGQLLQLLANIVSNSHILYTVIGGIIGTQIPGMVTGFRELLVLVRTMTKLSIVDALATIWKSAASIPGIGYILGGAAVAGAASYLFSKVDDMVSPGNQYGKRTIVGPEGSIALNNKDTVIAGTNLFENKKQPIQSTNNSIDLTALIKAVNEVKQSVDKLHDKEGKIYMDSKQIGTTLTQGSYKLA